MVDDYRDAADTLAEVVRLLGHDVDVAYDAASALDEIRAAHPDVLLMEPVLSGTVNGYDLARAIRAERLPIRIVAVTTAAAPGDAERARCAGFDAHLPKPADPAQIERLLT